MSNELDDDIDYLMNRVSQLESFNRLLLDELIRMKLFDEEDKLVEYLRSKL